mmetsp:Transcript_13485/g.19973  ORF Transcript_13485/g.19973 Transcript_13485/m.19973 type:complete len:110 (-) Transcript_13485:385-714(-)
MTIAYYFCKKNVHLIHQLHMYIKKANYAPSSKSGSFWITLDMVVKLQRFPTVERKSAITFVCKPKHLSDSGIFVNNQESAIPPVDIDEEAYDVMRSSIILVAVEQGRDT